MTVEQYAKRHGLSIETVRRHIRSGKLKARRKGRAYVIDDTNDRTRDTTDDRHTQQLLTEKDARIAHLQEMLATFQPQVERLEAELSESRQRSDTIIMQLSKTVEAQQLQIQNQTLLIEDLRQPRSLLQRWFRRRSQKVQDATT